MRFGSVCSGIEAASVAFSPLGWQAAWLAEIEPFPCAVLAHHYPEVPNLGDMTTIARRVLLGDVEAPDMLCGGTPCQAFSVAGLRASLSDERGNLTLKFVELADAIDHVRVRAGKPESIVLWENVPGVLSTKDNAFGCFLAGLAGEDEPLQPSGGRWSNAGAVYGPARAIAWRTLDAQYFGVAQRRRRVFVVASARNGFDPAAVLFEWDGVRRDTAPSREARKVAPTIPSRSSAGGGLGTDFDCDGGTICVATGQAGAEIGADMAPTLNCNHEAPYVASVCPTLRAGGNKTGGDRPPGTDVDTADSLVVAHTLRGEGFDASEDGTGRGAPLVPVAFHPTQDPIVSTDGTTHAMGCGSSGGQASVAVAVALRGREGGATAELGDEVAGCLRASSGGGDKPHVLAPAVDTLYNKGIVTLKEGNASTQETYPGTLLRALRQEVGAEAFAKWGLGILDSLQQAEVLRQALHGLSIRPASFSRSWVVCCALGFPVYGSGWLLQSLREAGCERCSSQGWEPSEQLAGQLGAYLSELSRPGAQAARFMRDLWFASEGVGLLQQALLAVQEVGRPAGRQGQSILGSSEGRGEESDENVLSSGMQCQVSRERVLHETCAAGEARDSREGATEQERSGKGWVGETPFAVRRLTVEECEFLQGFPRGYSKIPWRKKPASECPDGPRYKALGNSWAVPVAAWLGRRIEAVEAIQNMKEAA